MQGKKPCCLYLLYSVRWDFVFDVLIVRFRLTLHNEKANIVHELNETTKLTSYLESQLRR